MRRIWLLLVVLILISGCNPANSGKDQSQDELVATTNETFTISDTPLVLTEDMKLSDDTINDLFVLGKIWGYLKYYHPNVAKGDFDWDEELVTIIPKIAQSNNSKERDHILSNWIITLGTIEQETNIIELVDEIKIAPDLDWITTKNLEQDLVSQLINIKDAKRENSNYYVSLTEYVGNPQFENEKKYWDSYPSLEYRLLSLFRYWNIIEYYFPYKYLIEEDWDLVLKEFIPKMIGASSEQEYKLTVLEMIARIHDTHANILWSEPVIDTYWGVYYAPLVINFVENQAVVTGYYDDELGKNTGIKVGDIITKINNKPVEEFVKENLKFIPASNYPTQLRDIASKLLRTNNDTIKIEYVREANTEEAVIPSYHEDVLGIQFYNPKQLKKDYYQKISEDIAYIYLGSLRIDDIPDMLPKINNTKGLIIDLRSYPLEFIIYRLGEFLFPEPTDFVKFTQGSISNPGLFTMTDTLKVGVKNEDYYKGKIIILINELTLSQAEFTTMAFRTAPRAIVIGSTTAGADGGVSFFTLPGYIQTSITGIGVYYPDGTETQRVGIVPDIVVTPTIQGIKENRDELLEKAIELINVDN